MTVEAQDALPGQIPPLLYAISGSESQRLAPVNEALKASAAMSSALIRVEQLRYLPSHSGTLTLPPISFCAGGIPLIINGERRSWREKR